MIKTDLLEKVYLAFQNLDGWQDCELHEPILDAWSGNLHLIAILEYYTEKKVQVDIEIFDENIKDYVVETQQIICLDGDIDTDVGLVLDFIQDQIEYAQDIT
jgi:hypothetical protein